MKNKLRELYENHWENLCLNLNEILEDEKQIQKPTNPLLINLDKVQYENSDIKVLIFGQETNDWEMNFNSSIEHSLSTYNDFYNSGECFIYGGHFWNGFRKFLNSLKENFNDKKICAVWNNVIKIGVSGRDQNKPNNVIYNIEKENFNIINDEINILKPDIILFMSGPNYDNEIRNSLSDIEFIKLSDEFSVRELSKILFKNYNNIYRTYHPNYLYRNNIDKYFNIIINDIKL